MLQAYWNLSALPFQKSIHPDQLFISQSGKELNSRLQYMKNNRGIFLLTGQPGAGKTTALRAFVQQLSDLSFQSFYVPLATVNVLDFYRQINQALHGDHRHLKVDLFRQIQLLIKDLVTQTKKIPVFIFDEAHLLKNENFTELQILSNFNMDSSDPALFILAGQPHLSDRLTRPMLISFYQRITLKYHLLPLTADEINPFIDHNLRLVGCHQSPFSQNAYDAIWKNTNGLLRRVADLALKTMTCGMLQKTTSLTEEHVFLAAREL
jgi:type II secretory pathway predicted ATPase ExeA